MATEITVRGSFSAFHPPERGIVHATIAFEGAAMEPVYERVAADLEALRATIEPLKSDYGPITWWSAEQLRTWSARPSGQGRHYDPKQLPLVHHASVGVRVKFSDFSVLSRWVAQHVVDSDGFRVSRVDWALTDNRRDDMRRAVRTQAVQDAITRAQQYADALGVGKVRPVAVADAGLLTPGLHPDGVFGGAYRQAAGLASSSPAEIELVLEDIEITASVDARFVADV